MGVPGGRLNLFLASTGASVCYTHLQTKRMYNMLTLTLKQSFCSPAILQIRPRSPW